MGENVWGSVALMEDGLNHRGKIYRVGAEFMGKCFLMGISRNQRREDLLVAEQCMRICIFSQI